MKIFSSTSKRVETYEGVDIFKDDDAFYFYRKPFHQGKIEFPTLKEAEKYIDKPEEAEDNIEELHTYEAEFLDVNDRIVYHIVHAMNDIDANRQANQFRKEFHLLYTLHVHRID